MVTGASTSSGRVQRKRGKRINEIVTAAAELFGEHGYDAVSLDDVAERLDVVEVHPVVAALAEQLGRGREDLLDAASPLALDAADRRRVVCLPAAHRRSPPARSIPIH